MILPWLAVNDCTHVARGDDLATGRAQGADASGRRLEAEVADFLARHTDLKTEDGRQRIVRHGHLPEREVMTSSGPAAVHQPRVGDREAAADDPGRIRFA